MTNEEKILDILAVLQGEVTAIRKDMDARFDKVDARFDRVETDMVAMQGEIGAIRVDMSAMQNDITKIKIDIEHDVNPKIEALAEGQKSILEMLVPRSRVDDLEEEVKMLKVFMRQMGEEMQTLKKAQ